MHKTMGIFLKQWCFHICLQFGDGVPLSTLTLLLQAVLKSHCHTGRICCRHTAIPDILKIKFGLNGKYRSNLLKFLNSSKSQLNSRFSIQFNYCCLWIQTFPLGSNGFVTSLEFQLVCKGPWERVAL